jgi:radical SAM superfamily enzyme YgiQ (UPF0313 family)
MQMFGLLILNEFNKGFNVEIAENAVSIALSSALVVRTNWIIGSPSETEETIQKSISLAKKLQQIGPHVPHISFLIPYPGTPICDQALALGLIKKSQLNNLSCSTHDEPIMPSLSLSKDRLKELFQEFHFRYFNSRFFSNIHNEVAEEARLVMHSSGLN